MAFDPQPLIITSGVPSSTAGTNGQYALDPVALKIYGPKASGAWPSGVSFAGSAGTNGTNGTNGSSGTPGNVFNVVTKTASYTVLSADVSGDALYILANATSGGLTITIDAALLYSSGASKSIVVKQIDTSGNIVTLAAASGETIDGASSVPIPTGGAGMFARQITASSATTLYQF